MQMLQKIYIKIEGQKPSFFYIENKNFDFKENRVFDKEFNNISIDRKLFTRSKDLIVHNLHFPEVEQAIYDDYDIALGSSIKTPKELL